MFRCDFCEEKFVNEKHLLSHLRDFHKNDSGFFIRCNINDCPAQFENFNQFYVHRHRKHNSAHVCSNPVPNNLNDAGPSENVETESVNFPQSTYSENTESLLGKFILNLRASTNIAAKKLNEIIDQMKDIVENSVKSTLNELDSILKSTVNPIDLSQIVNFDEIIENSVAGFKQLNTTYKQDKYFSTNFNVTAPRMIDLSREIITNSRNEEGSMNYKIRDKIMIYIPLKDVVSNLLQNTSIRKMINEKQNSSSNTVLKSFYDGSLYKNCNYFVVKQNPLQFILYYDELEVCNPLGSKAGVQKLGMFYMVLGNIPYKYRSCLKMINLIAIVKASYVKSYGMDKILEPIVNDLKEFENGVTLSTGENVFGKLIALTGDNLGVHSVAGLKEGFTAHHCCRYCMSTIDEVRQVCDELNIELRSARVHDEQIQELESAFGSARSEISKSYGINRESLLGNLQHYHIIDGIPPDIMHDILEGVLPLTVRLLLSKICIESKTVTLQELNAKVTEFDYGYTELLSKPSIIKVQHLQTNLNQNASQMWQLAYMLPLIIGSDVSLNCPYWDNFTVLLEACSIIFSPCITMNMIEFLRLCIEEYLHSFQILYNKTLIPKQHFLIHYPQLILKFGPLIHFWSMRIEAKHQYFKSLVHAMRNFKNTGLSLARKHQLYQAYTLNGYSFLNSVEFGPAKIVDGINFPFLNLLDCHTTFYVVPCVCIDGVKYVSKKCFILSNCTEVYEFMQVHTIISQNKKPLFICLKTKFVEKDSHTCAYLTELSNEYIIIDPFKLEVKMVFHMHFVGSKTCILMKQAFISPYT
jgi:hypothetical protein